MKLVLFDIDCTLLWTNGAGREAMRRSLLEIFGTAGAIEKLRFGGKTDWQVITELVHEDALPGGYSHEAIAARIPDFHAAMARNLAAIIHKYEINICEGAPEAVDRLRERDDVQLGLVTGNMRESAFVKLRIAGFDPAWFPIGAYGHESMHRSDLTPLALQRAIEHYGYPFTPQDTYVIGDTPNDVACARAIGAWAIAVNTGFEGRASLEASQPDHLLENLTELRGVL